jgi:hypothetical protein
VLGHVVVVTTWLLQARTAPVMIDI